MLKKGDSVVYSYPNGMSSNGMEYGVVETLHGEWVSVRPLSVSYDENAPAFVVVALKDIVSQDADPSAEPYQVQQAALFARSFLERIGGDENADVLRDALQEMLLKMHSIGFMEGQGVTVSEPWEWSREAHRVCSAFVRYHDFCSSEDSFGGEGSPTADGLPDAGRLCEFLVWAKKAVREGGACGPEQVAMVYCGTTDGLTEAL